MVRITCSLGSSVSEEYSAYIFSKLSQDDVVCFVRTVCIPDCLVLVWRDTIALLCGFGNEVMLWRCRFKYEILVLGFGITTF